MAYQTYDISAAFTPPYTRKKVWMKLGKATQLEDGKILMNILTWPLSEKHWDGELVLYPNTNPSQHVSD